MNFQIFSDEFLGKWLTPDDRAKYSSLNDRKLIAGTNWLKEIAKSSFNRYDLMWGSLKEKCLNCMKDNCQDDYEWIIKNAQIVDKKGINSEDLSDLPFKRIKFPNKEIGKEGYEKVKSYHSCKKSCYEKVNIMNVTFTKKMKQFSHNFNICIVLCKGKPIDKETMLSDCYSDCMIKSSYEMAKIEYYIKMMHEKLLEEYDNKILTLSREELIHNERFKERELTSDLWRRYI